LLRFGHADGDGDGDGDASRGKRDVGGDSTDAAAATSPNRQADLLPLQRRQMKTLLLLLLLLQKCKRNNKITSDVAFLLQSFNATSFLLRNGKPKQNQTKRLILFTERRVVETFFLPH